MPPDLPSNDRADEPLVEHAEYSDPHYDPADDWDKKDPRRQKDCFAPPIGPCECYCLHCQRTFMSDQIWLQRIVGRPEGDDGMEGFWMCPTPNCDGKGFTFDIFPTDPDHPANASWTYDDDDEEEFDEEEFDDDDEAPQDQATAEYDPDETKWKTLDEELGEEDDDIEGEEWKFGLEPGESPPPQMFWSESAPREWEEEQKRYDSLDERPREIPWEPRYGHSCGSDGSGEITEDDIPF